MSSGRRTSVGPRTPAAMRRCRFESNRLNITCQRVDLGNDEFKCRRLPAQEKDSGEVWTADFSSAAFPVIRDIIDAQLAEAFACFGKKVFCAEEGVPPKRAS